MPKDSSMATRIDNVPIWNRPLDRAPKDIGENIGVSGISATPTFLDITLPRYTAPMNYRTKSKNAVLISSVSVPPLDSLMTAMSFGFIINTQKTLSFLSTHP